MLTIGHPPGFVVPPFGRMNEQGETSSLVYCHPARSGGNRFAERDDNRPFESFGPGSQRIAEDVRMQRAPCSRCKGYLREHGAFSSRVVPGASVVPEREFEVRKHRI